MSSTSIPPEVQTKKGHKLYWLALASLSIFI